MGRKIDIDDYIEELQKDGKYVVAVLEKRHIDEAVNDLKEEGTIPEDYEVDHNDISNDMEQALWDTMFGESTLIGQLKGCIEADSND